MLRSNSCTVVLSVGKKSISFYSLFARLIICYLPPPSSHHTSANIYVGQPSDASRGPIMLAFVRSASLDCATLLTITLFAHPPQQTLLADHLPLLQLLRLSPASAMYFPRHILSSSCHAQLFSLLNKEQKRVETCSSLLPLSPSPLSSLLLLNIQGNI